jgi:DNA-binding MarR family transcriptional regulator
MMGLPNELTRMVSMVSNDAVSQDGTPPALRDDFLLAGRTGFLFHRAALLLAEDVERALLTAGMRTRYFFVLASLAGGPTLSQQDLSRLLNLDPTTVVTVIDEMEHNGHVERRRSAADRRRYELFLTDDGRETLAKAEQIAFDAESAYFSGLGDDERTALVATLRRVLEGRWPASVCTT